MSRHGHEPTKWELAHYAKFAGKTIVRVELLTVEGCPTPVPAFTFNDATTVLVWNGPEKTNGGFIQDEELIQQQ